MAKFKKNEVIVISVLLSLFIILALIVSLDLTTGFDRAIYNFIIQFKSSSLTFIMKVITNLASPMVILFLMIIGLLFLKEKRIKIFYILNLVNIAILNKILKAIFSRTRPSIDRLTSASGYSFPSGHAMLSCAFYGFLIYLIWRSDFSKNTKIILYILICLIIFLVGLSRIYLGVHYPTDVIAGFIVSALYLVFFVKLCNVKSK